MAMNNTKICKEHIDSVSAEIDRKLSEIKDTYVNTGFGFDTVAESGFSKSNVMKDFASNVNGIAVPEESEMPSLGTVNGYNVVNALPLKGYGKNGVIFKYK